MEGVQSMKSLSRSTNNVNTPVGGEGEGLPKLGQRFSFPSPGFPEVPSKWAV